MAKEIRKPIKLERIAMHCDTCGHELKFSGYRNNFTEQHFFEHKCNRCSKIFQLPKEYPYLMYEFAGIEYRIK